MSLISITVPDNEFDLSGYLTSSGKASFWKEIDCGMKKFDEGDIKLRPRNFTALSNDHKKANVQTSKARQDSSRLLAQFDLKRENPQHRKRSRSSSGSRQRSKS